VYLTAEQVARKLGVPRSLVYAAMRSGRLTAVRIGCRGPGTRRTSGYDVSPWLETLKVSERPPDDEGRDEAAFARHLP
jgi:excisionase family DNA binding protein